MTAAGACAASIGFDDAHAILAAHALPLGKETVAIGEAGNRRLAAPIHAVLDAPRRDCAAMDGYAVRDEDMLDGTICLRPVGISYAGCAETGEIAAGEAWRVMTGAPMPRGADRVVMIEHCRLQHGLLILDSPPLAKPHIRRKGSDFAAGDMLLAAGTRMTAAKLVVAAAADRSDLEVWRRPRIALVATGDEIIAPGSASMRRGAIPDSLSDALEHLCVLTGADVTSRLRLPDDEPAIVEALGEIPADAIVLIGGASRGDRDYGRSALKSLGLEIAFADVAMKPGKPVWYGRLGKTHVLGIPGNPTAAFTIARLFLAPLIGALSGDAASGALHWHLRPAVTALPANGPREAFLCGRLACDGVALLDRQEASAQAMLAAADCLIRRPANAPEVPPGALIPVLPLC